MKRVATSIIEVRDGTAKTYGGDYEAYLYYVNREIDEGEREQSAKSKATAMPKASKAEVKKPKGNDRDLRKEISKLEKLIASLDTQKKSVHEQLMQSTDANEALKLHSQFEKISQELSEAEDRWTELQEEMES